MDNVTAPFVVRRIAGAIVAEIRGVKLRPDLPDGVIAELRRLWLEHLVLFFHDQELTPEQHIALGRHFGRENGLGFGLFGSQGFFDHYGFAGGDGFEAKCRMRAVRRADQHSVHLRMRDQRIRFGQCQHAKLSGEGGRPRVVEILHGRQPGAGDATREFAGMVRAHDTRADPSQARLARLDLRGLR